MQSRANRWISIVVIVIVFKEWGIVIASASSHTATQSHRESSLLALSAQKQSDDDGTEWEGVTALNERILFVFKQFCFSFHLVSLFAKFRYNSGFQKFNFIFDFSILEV